MPPISTVDLSYLAGPAPGLAVTGLTGAGSTKNLTYVLQAAKANGKYQWANSTNTIAAAANGDWLISSGATVLYRMEGSLDWPWSDGDWAGENSGTGTPAFAWTTITPVRSGLIEENPAYAGDPPDGIETMDPDVLAQASGTFGITTSEFTVEAVTAGQAGNAISLAVAAVSGGHLTSVTMDRNRAVSIAAGTKARMTISGITDPIGTNKTLDYAGDIAGIPAWSSDGTLILYPTGTRTILYKLGNSWYLTDVADGVAAYAAVKVSANTTPEGLTGWTVSPGSGSPTIAAAGSSTVQVETAWNADAEIPALATFTPAWTPDPPDGTGTIAALSKTHLTGGTGGPPFPVSVAP